MKTITQQVKKYWDEKPLMVIMLSAIFFRLLAVIFSKGFGWHDDHFLVIEPAQSWVDGRDYNSWLPENGNTSTSGHSFFYPGLNFIILYCLKWIGIASPQIKMLIIRFIHAAFSLIIVNLGFKITRKLSDLNTAKAVGLMLALFWFMPNLSVRNLVEVVCTPFLMISCWMIIKNEASQKVFKTYFIAGLFAGIALCVRFQSAFFIAGLVLALLLQRNMKVTLFFVLGCSLFFGLEQGINDYLVWGRPFAEFQEYVLCNLRDATTYFNNPWFTYFVVVGGLLVPPIGIFLLVGFFRTWKKHTLLFLPTFLFFLFHSLFPNKQERFILPIIPFIIILGTIGWRDFVLRSQFWTRRKKLLNGCYTFSIIINFIALPVVSTMYSKKARVESMIYLARDPNIKSFAMDDPYHMVRLAPIFYLNKWIPVYEISENNPLSEFVKDHAGADTTQHPDYILFFEDTNLQQRVDELKQYFPKIHFLTTIEPGFMDNLLFKINPHNLNLSVHIYKVK